MSSLSAPDVYIAAFIGSVIFAVLLMVSVLSLVTAADTPAGEKRARDRLGGKLAGTRMWSMLEHRHVSPIAYVDQTPIADLRAQIKTCTHCEKQEQCDETLGYVGNRGRNYNFCPNRRAIDLVVQAPRAGANDG
ncbi:MAG TPA: hypothetical protein VFB36_16350 [Nevskiaceae bacterium]|nr:hypothetical protein [Nevskiaceae bacterium]